MDSASSREKIMRVAVSCLLVCAAMVPWQIAFGQPDVSPKEFYPRNYVNDGLPRDTPRPAVASRQPSPPPGVVVNAAPGTVDSKAIAGAPAPIGGVSDATPTSEQMPAAVVAYVNSRDREHFNRFVSAALKLHQVNKVLLSLVLHIGDYRNVTADHKASLERAGITLQPLYAMPEHLATLKSPVWEVFSAGQPIYFSGVFDIGRFFAADGTLKKEPVQEKASVSVQEMDGF